MSTILQSCRSIKEIENTLSSGELTAKKIASEYMRAIRQGNPEINAYTAINERALDDAEALDASNFSERRSLFGVPIAVKDAIETAGMRTAFGSIACKDFVPKEDATLVRRLKESGAIILGKTALPDWCLGFLSTSSISDVTKNPHDTSRDPGGSSSGSAAAVAAGMAVAAIGTDTAGSIRVPASFNGLVGVLPTPGRVSTAGVSTMIEFRDSCGPLAQSVEDCARILDVLVAYDSRDPATSINYSSPLPSTFLSAVVNPPKPQNVRLGVFRDLFGTHSGILNVLSDALDTLTAAGIQLVELPPMEGLRGFRDNSFVLEPIRTGVNAFLAARQELAHLKFEDLPQHHLNVLHSAMKNASKDESPSPRYVELMQLKRKWRGKFGALFAENKLDGIVFPTVQCLPPKLEDIRAQRFNTFMVPVNSDIANALQWPAMTIPIGKTRDSLEDTSTPEMPVGLDLLGMALRDVEMLSVGAAIEAAFKRSINSCP